MIVVIKMTNVISRNGNLHFRIRVPGDCQAEIGQSEIMQSLRTTDPLKASVKADNLTAKWKARFAEIRASKATKKPSVPVKRRPVVKRSHMAEDAIAAFRDELSSKLEKNMPEVLENETAKVLRKRYNYYADQILMFCKEHSMLDVGNIRLDLPELGLTGPWKTAKRPGFERRRRRVVADVLKTAREMIDAELGVDYSKKDDGPAAVPPARGRKIPSTAHGRPVEAKVDDKDFNIFEITELMLASKKQSWKKPYIFKAIVSAFSEWSEGRTDIRTFDKRDLISFVTECLPYIPKNASRQKCFKDMPLAKQVKMVKKDPGKHVPISQTTCENRLTALSIVFNYAKDQLGLITMNPVRRLEVQAVRSVSKKERGFTPDELSNFWMAIQSVRSSEKETSGRFWIPLLGLYHGFRLNEICSLFLKDVYQTDDGIWVIDVNTDGLNKTLKNKPSERIVPIHPYLYELGFLDYVNRQQSERSEGLLFPELTFTKGNGYGRKIGRWFATWKKTWLSEESYDDKDFHSFRHTFIQTAQNKAGMSDRCNHEITGHETPGVSSVHLGYSGRLKPAALLEELEKLRYGWE